MNNLIGQKVVVNDTNQVGKIVEELFHGGVLVVELEDGNRVSLTKFDVTPQSFLTESK